MTDLIQLHGLRVVASVGALPEERARRQPLELDLDLAVDLVAAGASDSLDDTVDYGLVCQSVEDLLAADTHIVLLEAVAERIAGVVLGLDARIAEVTVAVRKVRPPVPQDLATSGVRIARSR